MGIGFITGVLQSQAACVHVDLGICLGRTQCTLLARLHAQTVLKNRHQDRTHEGTFRNRASVMLSRHQWSCSTAGSHEHTQLVYLGLYIWGVHPWGMQNEHSTGPDLQQSETVAFMWEQRYRSLGVEVVHVQHRSGDGGMHVQVIIDQVTYGPVNNIANMTFFALMVESAPYMSQNTWKLCSALQSHEYVCLHSAQLGLCWRNSGYATAPRLCVCDLNLVVKILSTETEKSSTHLDHVHMNLCSVLPTVDFRDNQSWLPCSCRQRVEAFDCKDHAGLSRSAAEWMETMASSCDAQLPLRPIEPAGPVLERRRIGMVRWPLLDCIHFVLEAGPCDHHAGLAYMV